MAIRKKEPSKYDKLREAAKIEKLHAVKPQAPAYCQNCKGTSFRPTREAWSWICTTCYPPAAQSARTDRVLCLQDLSRAKQDIFTQAQALNFPVVRYNNAKPIYRVAAGEACWLRFLAQHEPEDFPDLAANLASYNPDDYLSVVLQWELPSSP